MKTLTIIAVLGLVTVGGFAADYTTMTTTELQALRGTVAVEDRSAYQAEMKSRVSLMNAEELATFKDGVRENSVGTQTRTQARTQTQTRMGGQMGSQMNNPMSMGGGRFR
jgi:hypothetical protein